MPIRAVLFDLDDTLWRAEAPPDWPAITTLQATALAADASRLGLDEIDLEAFIRRFWAGFGARFPAPETLAEPPLEERRWIEGPAMVRAALVEGGVACGEGDAACLWEALHTVPLRHLNVRLYADAAATVTALVGRGFRLGIVTARPLSAAIVARELHDQGLPTVFEPIVTSGELGFRKPHGLIFETALQRLGLAPHDVAVVGDLYEDDVVPVAKLGMVPVLKLNGRVPDPSWTLARHRVPSLGGLLDLEIQQRL